MSMRKNNSKHYLQYKLELTPGKFYVSKNAEVWCCFNVLKDNEKHNQAYCIRIADHRVEYFYLDGRYDAFGNREHSLVEEFGVYA